MWNGQWSTLSISSVCGEQGVVNSARPLSDITDERVVPLDYLATLMVLFIFMVLDRLFYSLGLCLGKVCTVPQCFATLHKNASMSML